MPYQIQQAAVNTEDQEGRRWMRAEGGEVTKQIFLGNAVRKPNTLYANFNPHVHMNIIQL